MLLVLHRMLHSGAGGTFGTTVGLHFTLLVQMGLGPWGHGPPHWMGLQPLGALRIENPQYHFSTEKLCHGGGVWGGQWVGAQAPLGLSELRIQSTKLVQIGFVVCLDSHQVEGGLCHFFYHLILGFFG